MSNKWVGISGIIIIVCLVVANLWLEPDSECESLTKENKGKQAFLVCLSSAQQGNVYAQNIVGVCWSNTHVYSLLYSFSAMDDDGLWF